MFTRLCLSLVLFRHSLDVVRDLLSSINSFSSIDSFYDTHLYIYDGSGGLPCGSSFLDIQACVPRVKVFYEKGENIGFGMAHNFNYAQARLSDADIFVVANPDISFAASDLLLLLSWLDSNPSVACIAPLVVASDGTIQYSAKRNPTVLSLALGRFPFLTRFSLLRRYDIWHRNLYKDYANECISSPYLSGCFLIIPSRFYSIVGGFSPKYFLHLEDADLVRRLSLVGETLHNPIGTVTHLWARGSHKSLSQTLYLIQSCIAYFRIWGLAFY
jgi:GT2 family glycosyltransferase